MGKTGLIVAGTIFAAVILVGAFGVYMKNSMGDMIVEVQAEAEAFAETGSKDDCLEEYVDRYVACDGLSCFTRDASFGVMCLGIAHGSSEEFCADKPASQAEFYESDWKDGLCKAKGLDATDCLNVYKVVEAHCSR